MTNVVTSRVPPAVLPMVLAPILADLRLTPCLKTVMPLDQFIGRLTWGSLKVSCRLRFMFVAPSRLENERLPR